MAKFFEISEENEKLVNNEFESVGLQNYMNLKVVGVLKSKNIISISKANPIAEYVGKCPDTIICMIFEEAFDRLTDEMKTLLIKDALNTVSYDDEKEKINIGCPQVTVTLQGYVVHGQGLINAVESGIAAMKQVEEERKAAKNGL